MDRDSRSGFRQLAIIFTKDNCIDDYDFEDFMTNFEIWVKLGDEWAFEADNTEKDHFAQFLADNGLD